VYSNEFPDRETELKIISQFEYDVVNAERMYDSDQKIHITDLIITLRGGF